MSIVVSPNNECPSCRSGKWLETTFINLERMDNVVASLSHHFNEYKVLASRRQQELFNIKRENHKLRKVLKMLQREKLESRRLAVGPRNAIHDVTPSQRRPAAITATAVHRYNGDVDVNIGALSQLRATSHGRDDEFLLSSPGLRNNVDVIAKTAVDYNAHATRKRRKIRMNKLQRVLRELNSSDESRIAMQTTRFWRPTGGPAAIGGCFTSKPLTRKQMALSLKKQTYSDAANGTESYLASVLPQQPNPMVRRCTRDVPSQTKSALFWTLDSEYQHSDETIASQLTTSVYDNSTDDETVVPSSTTDSVETFLALSSDTTFYDNSISNRSREPSITKSNQIEKITSGSGHYDEYIESQAASKVSVSPVIVVKDELTTPCSRTVDRYKIYRPEGVSFLDDQNSIEEEAGKSPRYCRRYKGHDELRQTHQSVPAIVVKEESTTVRPRTVDRYKVRDPECNSILGDQNLAEGGIEMNLRSYRHCKSRDESPQKIAKEEPTRTCPRTVARYQCGCPECALFFGGRNLVEGGNDLNILTCRRCKSRDELRQTRQSEKSTGTPTTFVQEDLTTPCPRTVDRYQYGRPQYDLKYSDQNVVEGENDMNIRSGRHHRPRDELRKVQPSEKSVIVSPKNVQEEPTKTYPKTVERHKYGCTQCDIFFKNRRMIEDGIEIILPNCKHYRPRDELRKTQPSEKSVIAPPINVQEEPTKTCPKTVQRYKYGSTQCDLFLADQKQIEKETQMRLRNSSNNTRRHES